MGGVMPLLENPKFKNRMTLKIYCVLILFCIVRGLVH